MKSSQRIFVLLEKIKSFRGANFICWNFGNFSFLKTFSSNSSTKTLLFYLLKKYKRNTKGNNYFSSSCPLYNYYYFLPTSSALSVRYNPGTNYFQILSTFCSSLGLSHYDWPEYIRDQPYTQSPRTKYLFWQTSIFLLLNESLASRSQPEPGIGFSVVGNGINQKDSLHSLHYQLKGRSWPIWWFLFKVTDFMTGASNLGKIEKVTISSFLFAEKI